MKRFTSCLSVFLLAFFLLTISAHANTPNRLEIRSAVFDLDNEVIYISGLNFGENPEVWLDDYPLIVLWSTDEDIEASLDGLLPDLEPGTYCLEVAMDGFPPSHPEKADNLDVTIGAVGPKGDKGDTGDTGPQGPKG